MSCILRWGSSSNISKDHKGYFWQLNTHTCHILIIYILCISLFFMIYVCLNIYLLYNLKYLFTHLFTDLKYVLIFYLFKYVLIFVVYFFIHLSFSYWHTVRVCLSISSCCRPQTPGVSTDESGYAACRQGLFPPISTKGIIQHLSNKKNLVV